RGRWAGGGGTGLGFVLAERVGLRWGALRLLDAGGVAEVVAEPEPLIEARASDLTALARLAWHLGDRHVPVQLFANRLRVRHDPAVETLLARLGAQTVAIEAPFDPEGGAYLASASGHHHNGPHNDRDDTHDPHHAHDHHAHHPRHDR